MLKFWTIIILLLAVRVSFFYLQLSNPINSEQIVYSGRIARQETGVSDRISFTVGNYSVNLSNAENLSTGDIVTFKGPLICYESFRCTRGKIDHAQILEIKKDLLSSIFRAAGNLRNRLQQIYFANLKGEQANLLSGIVLGGSDLDKNFKVKINNVGLSHIVAASGMNVTLVAGLVMGVLSSTGLNRRKITLLGMVMILTYVFIAGLSAAVTRAGIMGIVVLAGGFFGRKTNGFYSLVLAGVLMLWVSPLLLVDYGFLLSFASMMGQITLVTLKLGLPKFVGLLVTVLLQNLLAIMFTLPIVMIGFHTFSLISLLSNLLVVWTVEPLMIIGLLSGIVGFVSSQLAGLILIPAGILLNYFLWVVKILSNEDFLFKYENFNLIMAVGYYLILSACLYYSKHIKRH